MHAVALTWFSSYHISVACDGQANKNLFLNKAVHRKELLSSLLFKVNSQGIRCYISTIF